MLSLRRRLLLVHSLAILLAAGGTAAVGWRLLSHYVNQQLDGALLSLAEAEAGMLADRHGAPVRVHEAPAGSAPPSLTRLDRLVQIIDGDGKILARSANLGSQALPAPPALLRSLAAGETVFETLPDISEEPLRMVSVPALVRSQRFTVQVAGSLDDVNQILQSAATLFAGMAVALLLAMAGSGAWLSRRLFDAIDNIVSQARRIEESNLHQRLPHAGGRDEIGRLVDTLNAMLARLEHAFDSQRRFTADASHELRSPLSRLRAEIEITLRRPRSGDDYATALRSCLEEVERLTSLVEQLLTLARADAGQWRSPTERVMLTDCVRGAIDRLTPQAQVRGITIVLEDSLVHTVYTEAAPLGVVIHNILDNAIKYSSAPGQVVVHLAADGHYAEVTVSDQGAGLNKDELPFLFDRFFRGRGALARGIDGVGLGLSLSQAIIQSHGGHIEAANRPEGGARFVIRIPSYEWA